MGETSLGFFCLLLSYPLSYLVKYWIMLIINAILTCSKSVADSDRGGGGGGGGCAHPSLIGPILKLRSKIVI